MPYQLNSSNVVSDTIDGEVLAIRSDNGTYYSMRGPAATAWVALLGGGSLDDVATMVAAHHGADAAEIRSDIEAFARSLVDEALVLDSADARTADDSTLPSETRGIAWELPEFERYTDMRDLLLFDPIHEVESTGWPAVKPTSSD